MEISLLSLAIGFLILGTVAAIAELMPRDYDREATPEKYDQWLSELQEYNSEEPDPSSAAIGQAIAGRAEMAKERIQNNLAFNKQKSRLMMISFIAAAIALAVNLGIMITRLF